MKFLKTFEQYSEYKSTFTHNDISYDINTIFEISENYPVVDLEIKDLQWILEFTDIYQHRLEKADYTIPILVSILEGQFVVIDGVHRLKRAIDDKLEQIPSKLISDTDLNKSLK